MNHCKRILAFVLSAALLLSGTEFVGGTATEAEAADAPAVTELPGTNKTEGKFDASYFSVTGFAKGTVNDRTEYIGTEAYRVVKTEDEFLQALDDAQNNGPVKVIEIAADLELGWDRLTEEEQEHSCIGAYGWDVHGEVNNPSALESGASQLTISNTHGLTIFSRSGNTVEHAEWKLQGTSSDIIIRNITFDGMWYYADSSKDAGWTPLKLNGVKGVWIDHCSTTLGVDGNMDSENGASNMTASWNSYSLEADRDPSKNSMIYKTITYLEELYKRGESSGEGRYTKLRDGGAEPEDIMAYVAYHQKFSLNGSGEKDFKDGEGLQDGNQRLHITYAYDKVTNIGSRFPLIRQGTAHLFNCVVDNSTHMALHNNSKLPFYSNGGLGLNRALDGRNGASVGADTCVFKEVRAITGNEMNTSSDSEKGTFFYTFKEAYNHVLIVNSSVTKKSSDTPYVGSSWDNNGDNLFIEDPKTYWIDKSTIGDFKWFSSIKDAENYTREVVPTTQNPETGETEYLTFEFEYSKEDLPYSYKTVSLNDVETVVNKYAGAYTLNEGPEFWLRTEYSADETIVPAAEKDTNVKAEELTLSTNEMSADVGTLRQLDAYVAPSNASNKEVEWSSSDNNIAEVRDSGLVVVKNPGTVTITAKTTDGTNLSTDCTITADKAIESIEIVSPITKIYLGENDSDPESYQLTAIIYPDDATKRDVVWSSSNKKALLVDENGVLTPLAAASNVTISCASADNPSIKASVKITVKSGANPNPTPKPEQTETPEPAQTETPEPAQTETPEPAQTETPGPEQTETPEPAQTTEPPAGTLYWMGDANLDGAVTAQDALAILQHVVKLKVMSADSDAIAMQLADMNGDTDITASDALDVLRVVVKLKKEVQVQIG